VQKEIIENYPMVVTDDWWAAVYAFE